MILVDTRMSGTSTEMVSHRVQLELLGTTTREWLFRDDRDLGVHGHSKVSPDLKQSTHRFKEEDTFGVIFSCDSRNTFPTNVWIHKITKGKKSDRCDLCRDLWIEEVRFRTEKDLPGQTLGHIQHTCEVLSAEHIDDHHQCWRLSHGELTPLGASEWKFLCVSGEKWLQTIWDDITSEFKDIPYLNLTQDTIWNVTRAREMVRPLTSVEDRRIKEGIPRKTVVKESFWRMWSDGISVLPPVGNTTGIFCILEHKRMSDSLVSYLFIFHLRDLLLPPFKVICFIFTSGISFFHLLKLSVLGRVSMVWVREVTTRGVGWASEEVSDLITPPLNGVIHAFENIRVYIECSQCVRDKVNLFCLPVLTMYHRAYDDPEECVLVLGCTLIPNKVPITDSW